MTTTRRTLLRTAAGLAIASPALVRAQAAWPAKPITIVVNFPAGGLTDGIARAFGQSVQQATGQQVIIDNKPGASGNIGAALVARAPADGYTFLHSVSSTLVQNRVMFKSMGFNPDKDLTIISGTSSGVLPVVVHKSVPVSNLKEFIEYAKTNKVNFGSWALGSSAHIFAQALNEKYGLKIEVVTYKGEAPMWQDMGAGQLQAAMGSPQAFNALLVKGEIKPIVAPSRVRSAKFPDLATSAEQGFTDEVFTVRGWLALAAPAATPKPIVQKMSDLWVAAADSEPGRKMMESFGLTEKPLNHEEVMKDYEILKATVIPRIVALGITPESLAHTTGFDGLADLVTGAGRGLGAAYARLIAARGGAVVVHDAGVAQDGSGFDRSVADGVVAEIAAQGGTAAACYENLEDPAAGRRIIDFAVAHFGRLDALVHNAGLVVFADLEETTAAVWDRMIAIGVDAGFHLARAAVPYMRRQGYGRIVLTTSGRAMRVEDCVPGLVAYSTAKMAQVGLMVGLAAELAGTDIRVNAISPVAATRVLRRQAPELRPDLVAPGVAFLASRACTTSGAVLNAAGGRFSASWWDRGDVRVLGATPTPEAIAAHWQRFMAPAPKPE